MYPVPGLGLRLGLGFRVTFTQRLGHNATGTYRQEDRLINSELRSCVKVEVNVLGSSSLLVLMVSIDVKQH